MSILFGVLVEKLEFTLVFQGNNISNIGNVIVHPSLHRCYYNFGYVVELDALSGRVDLFRPFSSR